MFILDSHVTHTKNVTDIAREAGEAMVSRPPHTIHRFQPLGGAFWTVWEILRRYIEDVDERTCRQTGDNM